MTGEIILCTIVSESIGWYEGKIFVLHRGAVDYDRTGP